MLFRSKNTFILICFFLIALLQLNIIKAQGVPGDDEKIPFLVTFGKEANVTFGDDDFTQIWFFVVPENCKEQVFIRILDPDCAGKNDELNGSFNTKTTFSIYGGKGAHSDKEAKTNAAKGNFKSGIQLATKSFAGETDWDDK